ncbi:MAG TPA: hypothetical protein VET24_01985 [Actinomycetota bacterium]|nr:hypothetical protein [Actinomycetota bacterium]
MKLTRRELLHLGFIGAGGLVLGGLYEKFGTRPNVLTGPTFGQLLSARRQAGDGSLQVFVGGEDYVAGVDNYVVLFLQHGGANGARIFGTDARMWITPTADPSARLMPTGPIPSPWFGYAHPDGPPPLPQGLNAVRINFSTPGFWTLIAETTTQTRLIGTTYIQVKAKGNTDTKIPGDAAIPSLTPTVANNEGVSPICTRKPPCDMHEITLKDAISSGKPTAFFVGTPEFCQSRNCGPSLDELIAVEANLRGRANFVHAEVYLNDQTQTIERQIPSPTFKEWAFQSEPWLFVIDRNGIIAARFEGGFTASQAQAALQPLMG